MAQVFAHTKAIAATDLPVLIVGESGCGKAELATQLHRHSRFESGPLVVVNCASLDPLLAESILFGHERGAFTGAFSRRVGLIEQTCCGTLVLDDFQNLPLAVQAKLLRVLETGLIRRLGAQGEKHCEVRVIICMNRDPGEAVAAGRMHKDLLFRIEAGAVVIPPVRERPEDIPALVESLVQNTKMLRGRTVTPAAICWLQQLDLQGNVRELRTILVGAAIGGGDVLDVDDLKRGIRPWHQRRIEAAEEPVFESGATATPPSALRSRSLNRAEVVEALENQGFNQSRTARWLGIPRQSFREMLQRFGLMNPWKAARDLVRRGLSVPLDWARQESEARTEAVAVEGANVPRAMDAADTDVATEQESPEPQVRMHERDGVIQGNTAELPRGPAVEGPDGSQDEPDLCRSGSRSPQADAPRAKGAVQPVGRWQRSQGEERRQADDTEVATDADLHRTAEPTSLILAQPQPAGPTHDEGLLSALLRVFTALQLQLIDLRLALDARAAT